MTKRIATTALVGIVVVAALVVGLIIGGLGTAALADSDPEDATPTPTPAPEMLHNGIYAPTGCRAFRAANGLDFVEQVYRHSAANYPDLVLYPAVTEEQKALFDPDGQNLTLTFQYDDPVYWPQPRKRTFRGDYAEFVRWHGISLRNFDAQLKAIFAPLEHPTVRAEVGLYGYDPDIMPHRYVSGPDWTFALTDSPFRQAEGVFSDWSRRDCYHLIAPGG